MIKSFKTREETKLFQREFSKKFPPDVQKIALRKLWMINAAANINDLRIPPSNHLEALKGDRKGEYSIRINKKWRICFKWINENAYDLEITDYR